MESIEFYKNSSSSSGLRPDVSVVFVNFKTCQLVESCLRSIVEKTVTITFEVIIVDNSNESAEYNNLKDLADKQNFPVTVVNPRQNLGFGKANNLGASFSNSSFLLFLNTDTLLMNNAIYEMWNTFAQSENVGAVGGNLFSKQGKPEHSFFVYELNKKGIKKSSSIYAAISRKLKDNTQFNHSGKILEINGYITGACLMIPKLVFENVGGFDRDIFMYGEDNLLCSLIKRKGYKLLNNPKAQVIHYCGASDSTKYSERKIHSIVSGNSVCIKKLYGPENLSSYLSLYSRCTKKQAIRHVLFLKFIDYENLNKLSKEYRKESKKAKNISK